MRRGWKHRGTVLAALLCAAAATCVLAAAEVVELRPYRDGGWLRLDLRARDLLDARTTSTIESGLPGTCVYHLRVEDRRGRIVIERLVESSLRFDLWENVYRLEESGAERTLPTLAAADSAWSRLRGQAVCRLDRLEPSGEYRLAVRVAVQPLEAADRERLSRYVSRHSGGGGEEVTLDLGALVSGIFGRRGGRERTVEYAGPYFRPADLEERP